MATAFGMPTNTTSRLPLVTDDADEFAASLDLQAKDGEAAVGIVESHPLDAASQRFGRHAYRGHGEIIHGNRLRTSKGTAYTLVIGVDDPKRAEKDVRGIKA